MNEKTCRQLLHANCCALGSSHRRLTSDRARRDKQSSLDSIDSEIDLRFDLQRGRHFGHFEN
jgi:hypothetical protein